MAISGIGSSFSTPQLTSSGHDRAQKLLQQMDTDSDGKVSKQEFTAMGEKMRANGPRRAGEATAPQGANAKAPPSADDMFAQADSDGDGSLSIENLSAMISEHATHAAARGGQGGPPPGGAPPGGAPPGGAPPGSGGHASGGAGGASSSSSSSSSDPADSNQDGTVSAAEKLAYEFSHPSVSDTSEA